MFIDSDIEKKGLYYAAFHETQPYIGDTNTNHRERKTLNDMDEYFH